MADVLASLPLGKKLPPGFYGAKNGTTTRLRLVSTDACTLVAGRDRVAVIAKARAAFAIDLQDVPRRSAAEGFDFVGVGPGRRLVLPETRGLAQKLEGAFAPEGSVFEQGGGLVVLEASGAMRDALAKLVPIDLHPSVFKPGDAATTIAAHVNITVWLERDDLWRFAVGRSLLSAFLRAFACVSLEFGLDWDG
jgi:methylglutamate dehydrogenase subunit D